MAASLPQPTERVFETVGDVLARFGDIPADRILTQPPPGTAVEADVLAAEGRGKLCELVDGVLIEKAMGAYESQIAGYLIFLFHTYFDKNRLGTVFGESGMVQMGGG